MSKAEFAKNVGIAGQNIEKIVFQKASLDTNLLCLISEVLDYNLFSYYKDCDECNKINYSSLKGIKDALSTEVEGDSNIKQAGMNDRCKNMCGFIWIPIIINFVFLIVIVCVLAGCFPCAADKGFDYMGVIVGVLALLVTVLIGWNIYSILDVRQIRIETDKFKSTTTENIEMWKNEISSNLDNLKVSILEEVAKKIAHEREFSILKDLYSAALENMNNNNNDTAFIGFCNIACYANKMNENTYMIKSVEWANTIVETLNNDEWIRIRKRMMQSTINELKIIDMEDARDIVKQIKNKFGEIDDAIKNKHGVE